MQHVLSVVFANEKVLRRVVLLIKISMVNFFSAAERSPKDFLGNQNMLKHVPLGIRSAVQRIEYFSVPLFDNERLLSMLRAALNGTVFRVLVMGYKFRSAVAAYMRSRCRFFSRLFWRGVCQAKVVSPAVPLSKVRFSAALNDAISNWAFWFRLLLKVATLLPRSIARGVAKRHLGIGVHLPGYLGAAMRTGFSHG